MPLDVPSYTLPASNRQVCLTRRPTGIPASSDFAILDVPLPLLEPGQALIRNIYLSVDPAQRGWASSEANYSAPVPLGQPMRALAVGIVVDSREDSIKAGDYVYGFFGWQYYAAVNRADILVFATQPLPLTAFGSLVGINGLTAYLALFDLGRPRPSETVLVSTAAGSVGSFVGQIARAAGCHTIGLTSRAEKIERCTARYGYDAAINYTLPDLDAAIRKVAGNGIDVYFDNAGGAILDTVIRQMGTGGRVVQCGTASISSWHPAPVGLRNEREILTRRLSWQGFVIFDHRQRFADAAEQLARLYADGSIVYDVHVTDGIETAVNAIGELYSGDNSGKRLVFVG